MKTTELASLIKSRRSIRSWQQKPVSEDLLCQAIELATYAPNAGNHQIWYFYVILDKKVIGAIADVVQASSNYLTSLPQAAKFSELAADRLQRSGSFRSAPAVIAVASRQFQSPTDKVLADLERVDATAAQMRQWRSAVNSRIQSVASAIAYLLLILHQMGLGAVWMSGPMQAKGEIEKILKVSEEMDLFALIPVGYAAEAPAPGERKPVKEVCRIIK